MHFKYAKVLAIVVHENMKLANNTMNNERLFLVNTKFLTNKKKNKNKKQRETATTTTTTRLGIGR